MKLFAILAFLTATLPAATFEWKGTLDQGQAVEIRNVIGDIKAETAQGADVELSVQITGTYPDPSTIHIDVIPSSGGILFCTIYEGLSTPDHCTPETTPNLTLTNSNIRVTYTIRVPAGVILRPRTINGNLSIDLPENSVQAATVNGRVVLAANWPSSAAAVNGSILATIGGTEWTGSSAFTNVNGSVDVALPDQVRAAVKANTVWGHITNDFGLQVHKTLVASWINGEINGGGPPLVLNTVNGSIHLRKSPGEQQ